MLSLANGFSEEDISDFIEKIEIVGIQEHKKS